MVTKNFQLDFLQESLWDAPNLSKFQRFSALTATISRLRKEFLKDIDPKMELIVEMNIEGEPSVSIQEVPMGKKEKHVGTTEVSILNMTIQQLYNCLTLYQETIYARYDMMDYYSHNHEELSKALENTLVRLAHKKCKSVARHITDFLEKTLNNILKDFDTNLKGIKDLKKESNIAAYIEAYESCLEVYISSFKEQVTEKFKDEVSEVFITHYSRKLRETIRESILVERMARNQLLNQDALGKEVYQRLYEMFWKHFNEGKTWDLFDLKAFKKKENIETLFSIVLLTDYRRTDGKLQTETYVPLLEKFYKMFVVEYIGHVKTLKDYMELVKVGYRDEEIGRKMDENLEYWKAKWSKNMDYLGNLHAMTSVFLAFNFLSEEKVDKSYNCCIRYILKCLFRNLKHRESQFANFDVLCCLESLYAEFVDNNIGLVCSTTSIIRRATREKIRGTSVKSISEHLHHADQLEILEAKLSQDLQKPLKFFFEKISNHDFPSKSVIIAASGYTSEDCVKIEEWNHICKAYPHSEVIALNWCSSAIVTVMSLCWKSIKEQWKSNLIQGTKDALVGSWATTYEQAKITGIYLAHLLADIELFKGHVVSLVGFSLGTFVVMSCVWELERMKRRDILYDVLVMGGVVDIGEFQKSSLKAVGHKLINCYCKTDYILKYLLRLADKSLEPIGTKPILWHNKKVENIDVTAVANGHTKYRQVLNEILLRVDFNRDL